MPVSNKIILLLCFALISGISDAAAQDEVVHSDSFFLANKKGILGRIGRSISTSGEYTVPTKNVVRYKRYQGKIIRTITVQAVGFNYEMNDDQPIKKNFFVRVADALHTNTLPSVIRKNLFFSEGQRFYPLLVADNERFLREQTFLRDAMIEAFPSPVGRDSVDIVILTRDVFSIGGKVSISNTEKLDFEIKEENLAGSGNKFSLFGFYDGLRVPGFGYGAEYIKRNIRGTFLNWTTGFNTFNEAFNSGRDEELRAYSRLEKPMASRYTAITGALELSYNQTTNGYVSDSLYSTDFRYKFVNADVWTGYNFGYKKGKIKDSENRLRHFVALRGFFNWFYKVPDKYQDLYNYNYADINGFLVSYNLYRQNFYRTNFVYGFGRNEDVPEGISASVIGGFTNKQGIRRAYYGLELDASKFNKNSALYSYTAKVGGFMKDSRWQDVDVLLGVDHFTKLKALSPFWYNRMFFSLSYTRQINPFLNVPLFLEAEHGLPYYRNGVIEGRARTTARFESAFFYMRRYLGFRFAPFVFTDLCLLQPYNEPLKNSNGYSAVGGGIRTRNENLVFGTIELRGFFFPRITDGAKNWKVEMTTKLRFKYSSSFIRRPDFVVSN